MDKPAAPKVEPKAAPKPAGAKKTQTVTKMSTKK
jgi:hypothetical protein